MKKMKNEARNDIFRQNDHDPDLDPKRNLRPTDVKGLTPKRQVVRQRTSKKFKQVLVSSRASMRSMPQKLKKSRKSKFKVKSREYRFSQISMIEKCYF